MSSVAIWAITDSKVIKDDDCTYSLFKQVYLRYEYLNTILARHFQPKTKGSCKI